MTAAGRPCATPPRHSRRLLGHRIGDDLAALLLALLLAELDDALALAAVLAATRVAGAGAGTLALAGVDARAVDLAARLAFLGARTDGTGGIRFDISRMT